MERVDVITELKKYFDIRDLVCRHTFEAFGNRSWQFLDTELLATILAVRADILQVGMTVNNWRGGGSFSQRGLRCNVCQIVKDKTAANSIYLSAHCGGAAIDFDAKGLSAEEAREKIMDLKHLLPYPIRMEKNVTWCHMDVYDYCNGEKINLF